jgi:hypothetical protein
MNTKTVFACCFLLALAVTATPSTDDVVPETVLMLSTEEEIHEEARAHVDSLIQDGSTKNACQQLADGTIKELKDGAATSQKLIDGMDMGKDCHKAGLAAYNAAKQAEADAKTANAAAQKASVAADTTKIPMSMTLDQLEGKNGCKAAKDNSAYKSAKATSDQAAKAAVAAQGAYDTAVKNTAAALAAHEKEKKDCACKAQKTHKSAQDAAKKVASDANKKEWSKAHHMKCVLAGTPASSCSVPTLPGSNMNVPSMPSWVAQVWCGTGSQYKPNNYNSNAGKGGWGGSCTCPDGKVYQVGDNMNSCGSLACFGGGKAGTCNRYNGAWSKASVTCGAKKNRL